MNRMDQEEYEWNRKEALKHKSQPYMFSNEDYAISFFDRIRKEYPAASIHYYDIHQWICLNDRARAALRKNVTEKLRKKTLQMEQLVTILNQLG